MEIITPEPRPRASCGSIAIEEQDELNKLLTEDWKLRLEQMSMQELFAYKPRITRYSAYLMRKKHIISTMIDDAKAKVDKLEKLRIVYLEKSNKFDINTNSSKILETINDFNQNLEFINTEYSNEKKRYEEVLKQCNEHIATIDKRITIITEQIRHIVYQNLSHRPEYSKKYTVDIFKCYKAHDSYDLLNCINKDITVISKIKVTHRRRAGSIQLIDIYHMGDAFENDENDLFKQVAAATTRFICIPIGLIKGLNGHANIILIDRQNKTLEYYEPHGYRSVEYVNQRVSIIISFTQYGIFADRIKDLINRLADHITAVSVTVIKEQTQTSLPLCQFYCFVYVYIRTLDKYPPLQVVGYFKDSSKIIEYFNKIYKEDIEAHKKTHKIHWTEQCFDLLSKMHTMSVFYRTVRTNLECFNSGYLPIAIINKADINNVNVPFKILVTPAHAPNEANLSTAPILVGVNTGPMQNYSMAAAACIKINIDYLIKIEEKFNKVIAKYNEELKNTPLISRGRIINQYAGELRTDPPSKSIIYNHILLGILLGYNVDKNKTASLYIAKLIEAQSATDIRRIMNVNVMDAADKTNFNRLIRRFIENKTAGVFEDYLQAFETWTIIIGFDNTQFFKCEDTIFGSLDNCIKFYIIRVDKYDELLQEINKYCTEKYPLIDIAYYSQQLTNFYNSSKIPTYYDKLTNLLCPLVKLPKTLGYNETFLKLIEPNKLKTSPVTGRADMLLPGSVLLSQMCNFQIFIFAIIIVICIFLLYMYIDWSLSEDTD